MNNFIKAYYLTTYGIGGAWFFKLLIEDYKYNNGSPYDKGSIMPLFFGAFLVSPAIPPFYACVNLIYFLKNGTLLNK